jgi:serine/tyrosine/threonine adenylyltransferase
MGVLVLWHLFDRSTAAPRRISSPDGRKGVSLSCMAGWNFDNTYARLPERFFARVAPTPVRAPQLVILNRTLAADLGLDPDVLQAEGASIFAGNRLPDGAAPLAQAYAGHQFGGFTVLGDGRAILLGEQVTPSGARFDVQLKGGGPTPYSRRGDGRAALGPMLREFIVSEAMHALGIPTTRSLAVAATGEPVYREEILPGAVLTRVAASHLRVGSFEYFAARRDFEGLRALADYAIARHDPQLAGREDRYLEWLRAVMRRQAALVARWMHVGFIHGVMNTDNMALSGETIDYGPCAFMDAYDPATVFSSIDQFGRYAYGNQPRIALWNLGRFAEAILPLLHPEEAKAVELAEALLEEFPADYDRVWRSGIREKLGLFDGEDPGDASLVDGWLGWMQRTQSDFTGSFRALSNTSLASLPAFEAPDLRAWHERWEARVSRQPGGLVAAQERMRARNPAIIPRNHQVERALAAANAGDLGVMHRLLAALARPFDDAPEFDEYRSPPPKDFGENYRTFCGT